MSRLTSVFWDCSSAQLMTSLLKVSGSARGRECHASQHCTGRRRSGGWLLRRTPGHILRKKGTRANLLGDATTRLYLPLSKEVMDVLTDQTRRGQLIPLSEEEAKIKFPRLVIASLGANRKDRPNGEVTARVLHDGTNGLSVNTRTRLRDQELSPISSDIKRAMREKASRGLNTFALTADVKEAHCQIPIDPRDWHLLGCQVDRGGDVFTNTV